MVGTSLNNLAELYRAQGRYTEAESLYKRSIAISEKALGPEHPDVATSLNNLAELYSAQGRYAEAEPLHKRSLAIGEKALGPEHPNNTRSLNGLARLYHDQGRYGEAEPLYRRTLAIVEKVLGPEHPDVATSLNNLAELYRAQGRHSEAEPLQKRSLAIGEKALGPEHPNVANSLNNLALLYQAQGRYAEAEPLYKRSLGIREKALGPEHPNVANSLNNLAWLALAQRDWTSAAGHWRASTEILQRRAARGLGGASGGPSKGEAHRNRWHFDGLVNVTHRLAAGGLGDVKQLAWKMFEIAQWSQASEAAASLAQMAARSPSQGSPELATIVRERQDLVAEWQLKDKLLIAAMGEPPTKRNAAGEKTWGDRIAAIDVRLSAIDFRLAKDFPDYAALASPKPTSVSEVQSSLRDDEALVLFLDTNAGFKPLPEATFVWVVTNTNMRWVKSDLGTPALTREVGVLRCGLDATAWTGSTCRDLTGKNYTDTDREAAKPLPFDHVRAHVLYKALFGEMADLIKGKHLLLVPSGPLTQLPFQVLVTEPPKSGDHRSIRWLARDHALTVLPAVSSLKALRRDTKPSAATLPMIGFGNPLLDGNPTRPREIESAKLARQRMSCPQPAWQPVKAPSHRGRGPQAVVTRGGVIDLTHLKAQSPLPETADELCAVALDLKADVGEMRLGARATEREVKALSASGKLAQYRILHFATHGALAGQLSGATEPGLILTPPDQATEEDDGYLTASEIAGLKLDADWVILSACNTAGGVGGERGAEALSGFARAFFYAGARALLVSHWEVDSNATVKIISKAVSAVSLDKTVGRAEALRRSMLAMIDQGTEAEAHPSMWAPFVVVGEGAATLPQVMTGALLTASVPPAPTSTILVKPQPRKKTSKPKTIAKAVPEDWRSKAFGQ